MMTTHPNCKVIEDSAVPGEWRIETISESGRFEMVQTFRGADARLRAIDYARRRFGGFDEITLEPTGVREATRSAEITAPKEFDIAAAAADEPRSGRG
jgi:hypothetical protein